MKSIFLCGFMGCGKTTVGRTLAKRTGKEFIDMDKYIEKKENMTVSQIFETNGENYFRDLEHQVCCELSQKKDLIVATGGGALTFKRNVDVLKKNATVLFISVPLEIIAKRLKNDTTRPLLQRADKEQAMKELYEKRLPLYTEAATVVVDGSVSTKAVVSLIISTMGLKIAPKNQENIKKDHNTHKKS